MLQTPPAPASSTRCSGPHPRWVGCHPPGEGHLTPRAWTGRHQQIARRRCPACGQAGSARAGPLMARRQRPDATVVRGLQGQRGGVGDAGTAALGAGARHTGQRLPRVAAQRAAAPPRPRGQPVAGAGGQVEAAPAQRRPPQGAWGHTAGARGRWCRRGGAWGPRTPETAAARSAPGVARARPRPRLRTEGWHAAPAALLPGVGGGERPRRRGPAGRQPPPRRVAPPSRLDAPVGKGRHQTGHGGAGRRRAGDGGPRRVRQPWR